MLWQLGGHNQSKAIDWAPKHKPCTSPCEHGAPQTPYPGPIKPTTCHSNINQSTRIPQGSTGPPYGENTNLHLQLTPPTRILGPWFETELMNLWPNPLPINHSINKSKQAPYCLAHTSRFPTSMPNPCIGSKYCTPSTAVSICLPLLLPTTATWCALMWIVPNPYNSNTLNQTMNKQRL